MLPYPGDVLELPLTDVLPAPLRCGTAAGGVGARRVRAARGLQGDTPVHFCTRARVCE